MPGPSPWVTTPVHPSLADPIVRPARGPLTTSTQYPRSPETEPSSVSGLHEPERPRWMVAAMLGGAFLLGVGGVSLALSLAGGSSKTEIAGETVRVTEDNPVAAAATPASPATSMGGPTAVAGKDDEVVPKPAEVEPTEDEAAGLAEGTAPAEEVAAPEEAPLPDTANVAITSVPAGAEVFLGDERLGVTPLTQSLAAGAHTLVLKLKGYEDSDLAVTATPSRDPDAVASHEVTLIRLAVKPAPTYVAPTVRTPPPTPREVAPTPPKPVEPKPQPEPKPTVDTRSQVQPTQPATPPKPREVKLLEDLDTPAPKPKPAPKVNLLDEGEPAPKPKPKSTIQTLDEL